MQELEKYEKIEATPLTDTSSSDSRQYTTGKEVNVSPFSSYWIID